MADAARPSATEAPAPTADPLGVAAREALERSARTPGLHAEIEAALRAADRAGVDWVTRMKLRNAIAWQRELDGDRLGALRLFETSVEELRGRSDEAEALALAGLGIAFANLKRTAESLLALQRAIRLFESLGCETLAIRMRIILGSAAIACEAWPVLDRLMLPIYANADRLPPEIRRWAIKNLNDYALDAAAAAGLGLSSVVLIDHQEQFVGAERTSAEFATMLPILRAGSFAAAGCFAEAEAMLARADAAGTPRPEHHAQARLVRARILAAAGDVSSARTEAVASLDHWTGPRRDESQGRLFAHATRVGEFLLNDVGDPDAADRAFEAAASSVVRRLREIEEAFSRVPELREATAEDLALVAECREHARRATESELGAIRRAFERAARCGGEDVLARLARTQGPRALCAWCGSVRTGDDTWLPIAGHLPPTDDATHGICPPCRVRLQAELDRQTAR